MLESDAKLVRWLGIDMQPRWRRRVAVVATYIALFAAIATSGESWWGHPFLGTAALLAAAMVFGVFGYYGPVKSFETPPARGRIIVNGLDEWARYRFAAPSFEEATEEQQAELLRTYRVGSYLMPAKPLLHLDEREERERDSAVRWSRRWVGLFVACWAGSYACTSRTLSGMDVAALLMQLWVLIVTLPPARILWTEPDPREDNSNLKLISF